MPCRTDLYIFGAAAAALFTSGASWQWRAGRLDAMFTLHCISLRVN